MYRTKYCAVYNMSNLILVNVLLRAIRNGYNAQLERKHLAQHFVARIRALIHNVQLS